MKLSPMSVIQGKQEGESGEWGGRDRQGVGFGI